MIEAMLELKIPAAPVFECPKCEMTFSVFACQPEKDKYFLLRQGNTKSNFYCPYCGQGGCRIKI